LTSSLRSLPESRNCSAASTFLCPSFFLRRAHRYLLYRIPFFSIPWQTMVFYLLLWSFADFVAAVETHFFFLLFPPRRKHGGYLGTSSDLSTLPFLLLIRGRLIRLPPRSLSSKLSISLCADAEPMSRTPMAFLPLPSFLDGCIN